MDANASPLGSKTQKLFPVQDSSQDKDLISRLPEDILVCILSFLPTEEAIKTSVLSKRWRFLWMCIPNFSFYDYSFHWLRTKTHEKILELRASFLDSIDRVLLLRNDSCLRVFNLWLKMDVDASRFHSWLSAALKHKVQNLGLSLPNDGKLVLPDSLFTYESLRYFWLQMSCTLEVPSFICFSSLKLLSLCDVVFPDDQTVQQLLSGCPLLEDLNLYYCHWENIKEITIEIPTLRSFTFHDSQILPDHLLSPKIKISALNLETLYLSSYLTIELLPYNLPSLKSAKIDINNWKGGQEHSRRILKLISGLHNVKSLHVSSETLEPLLFAENVERCLPTFYNLTSLYSFVECPTIEADYYTSNALVYILQKSPNLETLDLHRRFKPQEQDMMLQTVPHCFQSCLKCFIISNIDGNEEDLCLLKHVFENAPFLKRLVIDCSWCLSEDLQKQGEICQQLQQLRGDSASCSIEFFPYEDPWIS